jgi:hypothetical protein
VFSPFQLGKELLESECVVAEGFCLTDTLYSYCAYTFEQSVRLVAPLKPYQCQVLDLQGIGK